MTLCLISDTHDMQDQVVVPPADILIHAGDLTMSGDYKSCRKALQWLNAQPHKYIVVIAGNHDFAFESPHKDVLLRDLDRITYLENSGAEINGLKIWGSPITPWFMDWAFNVQRGSAIRQYWDMVPSDTDILVTHGPPFGILDQARSKSDHLGCEDLAIRVACCEPKVHVFGHIHGGSGQHILGTHYVNASVVNEAYQVVNHPTVIEV